MKEKVESESDLMKKILFILFISLSSFFVNAQEDLTKLEALIDRYEKQVKISSNTLKTNQNNLQVARDDLQELKLENINLKSKVEDLSKRNEELYAQVNAIP